ncbi:MAG: WbqC family protein [Cyclobacteriaceae bacterium]|mgnify:CR=1 FL=1
MCKVAIIELHYLPSIPYVAAWAYFDEVIIESKESYTKQSFRNRCQIRTANKIDDLIVPIQKGNSNVPVQEIRIDQNQTWIKNHWRAIQSAYGNAPFFEHYKQDIEKILNNKPRFLFDLNLQFLELILKMIGLNKKIIFSQKYEKKYPSVIQDLRSKIHPKQLNDVLDFYNPQEYTQVFGNQFVKDLSVIDLIFCEGPNAINILKRSIGHF